MDERLSHDLSDIGISPNTFPMPRIEPFVEAIDKLLFVLPLLARRMRLRISRQPVVSFTYPKFERRSGYRVGETKRDKVGHMLLSPMWQISLKIRQ